MFCSVLGAGDTKIVHNQHICRWCARYNRNVGTPQQKHRKETDKREGDLTEAFTAQVVV